MCLKWLLACLLAGCLVLMSMDKARSVPLPHAEEDAAAWGPVRSLGKMWQYHRLLGISPDGQRLLVGGSRGLLVYDLRTGKIVHDVRTNESVQDAAFSPDGKLLAVAEWREGVKLRDATTMQVLQTLTGSGKLAAWQVRFSREGCRLICYSWWGHEDNQFWSYDLTAKKEIGWPAKKNADTAKRMMREGLRGWGSHLFSVEMERDNGRYTGYKVWVTDAESGKAGEKVALGAKDYFQFDLNPDGTQAIVMEPGEDPRIMVLKTGQTVRTLDGHRRWVSCAAFSPDGKLIATASGTSRDGHALIYRNTPNFGPTEIIVREAATGKVLARIEDKENLRDYGRIGFSPNGKFLYVITKERELLLWGKFPAIPADAAPLPIYDTEGNRSTAAASAIGAPFDKLVNELAASNRSKEQKVEAIFLAVLGRLPSKVEQNLTLKGGDALSDAAGLRKVVEALIASPEYVSHFEKQYKALPRKP